MEVTVIKSEVKWEADAMECVGHDYDLFWMKYKGTQVFWTSMGWHNLMHAQRGQSGPTLKLKEGKLRIREPAWELCNNPEMMVACARLVPVEVGENGQILTEKS